MKRYLKELVLLLAVFGGLPFDVMTDSAYAQSPALRLNGVQIAPQAASTIQAGKAGLWIDNSAQLHYESGTLSSIIGAATPTFISGVSDGVSAVAMIIDTVSSWALGKILSVRSGGVEKAYISSDGSAGFSSLDAPSSQFLPIAPANAWGVEFGNGSHPVEIGINTIPSFGLQILGGGVRIQALADPTVPTITTVGATGATRWDYYCVAVDPAGTRTLASPTATIANGNATLDGTNYNTITCPTISGATGYDFVRAFSGGSPSGLGILAFNQLSTTFSDTGFPALVGYSTPSRNQTGDILIDGRIYPPDAANDTTGTGFTIQGGAPGAAVTANGKQGGAVTITGRTGAQGTASWTAGAGGNVLVQGGQPGNDGGAGGAASGSVNVNILAPSGAANAGTVNFEYLGAVSTQWLASANQWYPLSAGTGANGTQSNPWGEVATNRLTITPQTVAAAGTLAINAANGSTVRITLGSTAITSLTLNTGHPGQRVSVEVIQDSTGGRTIPTTWTNVRFSGGSYTATATASKIDVLSFVWDGTLSAWLEVSRAMNM